LLHLQLSCLLLHTKKKDGQMGIPRLEVIGNVFYGCLVNFFMEELVLKALTI